MNFRIAKFEDRDSIANLHAESWHDAYRGIFSDHFLDQDVWQDREKVWFARFNNPKKKQFVLIAEKNNDLVGFICAYGNEHEKWGTLIDNLHVKKSYKSQGIGKELIKRVVQWTKQNYPKKGMYLEVLESNVAARRFYEKLGAIHQETNLWSSPDGGEVNDLIYIWPTINHFGVK